MTSEERERLRAAYKAKIEAQAQVYYAKQNLDEDMKDKWAAWMQALTEDWNLRVELGITMPSISQQREIDEIEKEFEKLRLQTSGVTGGRP